MNKQERMLWAKTGATYFQASFGISRNGYVGKVKLNCIFFILGYPRRRWVNISTVLKIKTCFNKLRYYKKFLSLD